MLSEELSALLRLDEHEASILKCLEDGPINISDLARGTKFPRTTLYTEINYLKKRGLIQSKKYKGAVILTLVPKGEIKEKLMREARLLSGIRKNSGKSFPSVGFAGFTEIHGKEAMFDIWKMVSKQKNSRLHVIQTTRSMISTLRGFKSGQFVPINKAIKRNNILVDGIIREDYFPTYLSLYKKDKRIQKNILQSFIGRMQALTLVRNEYLNTDTESYIIKGKAYLMNWEDEVGIIIENKNMVAFLEELFELVKGYGNKTDFSSYIKEWLTKVS